MKTRFGMTLALASAIAMSGAASAHAAGYAPVQKPEEISATVGAKKTLSFSGFQPNSQVKIELKEAKYYAGAIWSTTVTANGQGVATVAVPIDKAGTYEVLATGVNANGDPVTASYVLVAGKTGSTSGGGGTAKSTAKKSGSLAMTGANGVATQLWMAGGLVAVGGAVVALTVVRRRNAASVTSIS